MQNLKNIIEDAIRAHETQIQLFTEITENGMYMAIRQVMRENPDIFWFSHYSQSEVIMRLHYTIDEKLCKKIKKQIDDVVQNDFKLGHVRTLSVKEQVMYVYKWIALYCNYDIHSAHNQTIYSVFVHRHSVCTGIAKAALYLFKLLGIESRLIFGKMNNSEKDSRHCWLVVNIEGEWYHYDPTFALPETGHLLYQCGTTPAKGEDLLFYNFFCVDNMTIKQSRTIEEEELLPVCNNIIDYRFLQKIQVTPSRNGDSSGLGCILSTVGTTADIYLAHHEDKYHRRRIVAKVFRDDDDHELLRKELIIMRECAGSHLLRATDADFDKGILYIEQATPLPELLASHYFKLTVKEFCNLLIDIASGLKELLNHGIVYRDIHLNNIFLSEDSITSKLTYKLGDFGSCTFVDKDGKFASLTERGGVGSKWFMAPETWNEGIFDERSAVYGVGMIAYYLLNDLYPPFWKEYGEESLSKRITSNRLPIPSKLQESLYLQMEDFNFIFSSLNSNPSERFQTLKELVDSICICSNRFADELLIVGSEFKEVAEKSQAGTFCSSCEANSSVIVSNEEAENNSTHDIDIAAKRAEIKRKLLAGEEILLIGTEDRPSITFPQGNLTIPQGKLASNPSQHHIDDFSSTCEQCPFQESHHKEGNIQQNKSSETFVPCGRSIRPSTPNESIRYDSAPKSASQPSKGLFSKLKDFFHRETDNPIQTKPNESIPHLGKANSSIFAPSETKRNDYMMVQVFLYKDDEERIIACKAAEVDPDARRQNYTPLSVKLKVGDRVKAKLTMSGKGIEVDEPIQEMIWRGHYTDCQFGVYIPEDYKPSSMIGTIMLTVNDIPCGRMMFKTKIVSHPQKLYAKIESKAFQKIFISYSHKDESTVKYFAKAFQAQGVDYFFDRHYLKAGDVYPLMIKEYINSADLFILCWSKNAAESDYVQLERQQALALAFPQRDMEQATLSIHPISIEPRADYPNDMKEVYNFEEI